MGWATLITLAIEAIIECYNQRNENRNKIAARLRRPGVGEAWILRRIIRENSDLRGRELHREVREGMRYLANAEPDEIEEFLDEALGKE